MARCPRLAYFSRIWSLGFHRCGATDHPNTLMWNGTVRCNLKSCLTSSVRPIPRQANYVHGHMMAWKGDQTVAEELGRCLNVNRSGQETCPHLLCFAHRFKFVLKLRDSIDLNKTTSINLGAAYNFLQYIGRTGTAMAVLEGQLCNS